jgi:hypothetical protein
MAAGEAVDFVDTIVDDITENGLGTLLDAIQTGALSLSAIADLVGLFGTSTTLTTDPQRVATILNDIFVEGDALSITNQIDVDACCGGSSGALPAGVGSATGDPPVGYGDPDAGVTDRLCKVANWIHSELEQLFYVLYVQPPPNWYDIQGVEQYLRNYGDTSSLGSLLGGLYGSYQDLARALFGTVPDFEAIDTAWTTSQEAIICALHQSTDATDARTDVLAVLTLGTDELAFIEQTLSNNLLNHLWFSSSYIPESLFDAVVVDVDCDVCSCPAIYLYQAVARPDLGADYYQSVWSAGESRYAIRIFFGYDGAAYCGAEVSITCDNVVGRTNSLSADDFAVMSHTTQVYAHDTIPPVDVTGAHIRIHSNTNFTCRIVGV